ncbi:MAG: hypothetical protein AB7P03_18815 [Kofleriaceae bacterium]
MWRIAVLAVTLWSSIALADDAIVTASVLRIEHDEIYVNLGRDQGVAAGAALRIKRVIKLRHPITRKPVEDWIPIGSATITQAGTTLSRAVVGDLIGDIRTGDVAEVLIDRDDEAAPPPPPKPPAAGPKLDPTTAEVLRVFVSQTGRSLDARIAAWEGYLSSHGDSRYAAAIRHEIDQLTRLRDQMQPAPAKAAQLVATLQHSAPTTATSGATIPLVFVIDQPERVASAYLHYRPSGGRTYRRLLLVRDHAQYLRGAVPAQVVRTPGVDYFVEVSGTDGQSGLALGSPQDPIAVRVAPPPLIDQFASTPGRSSMKLVADYLDFATFDERGGDRTDRMITASVEFTQRLDSFVEAVGVGYGVFAGRGGFADRDWSMDGPVPRAGFHYGYADVELGDRLRGVHVSAGGKLIAGVGKQGFGLGVEGRLRIGDRDATNLLVSARTIDQVGFVSDVRFGARPLSDLLVGLSVGATSQPAGQDVGVKLGTELEWIGLSSVSILLRASWQGRTTAHRGIGGGAGLGVYW